MKLALKKPFLPKLLMHKILCCPQLPQLHSGGKLKPVLIVKIAIFWSYFHQNAANGKKGLKWFKNMINLIETYIKSIVL